MNLKEKILNVQMELKAPKNQHNDFGGYNYRSCEDILEAVKPLLNKYKLQLKLNDDLIVLGDRYYIRATAILKDIESDEVEENVAYAREEITKKGMDGSQITGASSSYARKYALNGLFLIDDVKDSDTTNTGNSEPTLEDAKKYVINFGKKHAGQLLIDVYNEDYEYIEWLYDNKKDEYLNKCIDLLDKKDSKNIENEDERLKLLVEFSKLVINTNTDKEKLYKHYEVENNSQMSIEQLKDAIDIMKKKGEENDKK